MEEGVMKQTVIATTDPDFATRMCAALARGEKVVLTASANISAASVIAIGAEVIEAQVQTSLASSLARSIEVQEKSPPIEKWARKAARPRWRQ
jgi:hypothetical protein